MFKIIRLTILILVSILSSNTIFASHIRAADITAERIGEKKYLFTLSVYSDFDNVADNPNSIPSIELTDAKIYFESGGGRIDEITVNRTSVTEIVPGETFENIFEFQYEFSSTGVYKVVYEDPRTQRNFDVQNIPNSGNETLHVESLIVIDGFTPINTTPKFTLPPIHIAAINQKYSYNPGAYDLDGDSLSFELIEPRGQNNTIPAGFVFPDDPIFGSPSEFKIDVNSGLITWDTPLKLGEYNIAFRVNEYRNGVRIGYVVRDMQILVIDSDNLPPVLEIPEDSCVVANSNYGETIYAYDPDDNAIILELAGAIVNEGANLFNVTYINGSTIVADLSWIPTCDAVSKTPIQGIASVHDIHPVANLYTIDNWNLTVIGEQPVLHTITSSGVDIRLEWDAYVCKPGQGKIKIYRAECDTSKVVRTSCGSGVPEEWGFQEIGTVGVSETSFVDDGTKASLSSGVQYYYLIAVDFGTPSFGESYASNILSANLPLEGALITKVSYDKAQEDSQIEFSWKHFEEPSGSYVSPYKYIVESKGTVLFDTLVDDFFEGTIFLDTLGFDSEEEMNISILDANEVIVGHESYATPERARTLGTDSELNLEWTNKNQWLYADSLMQKIYSFTVGEDTILIDSVTGGNTSYTIGDLQNGDSVCTYVELSYVYCFEGIDSVLTSFTNTSCSLIKDNIPPCPPILTLDLIDCDNISIGNTLNWYYQEVEKKCSQDVAFYELERQTTVGEGDFTFFNELPVDQSSDYDVEGVELMCYRIFAIDSSGNRSEASNVVCQDFCGDVLFPNIFTPNDDGVNDNFVSNSSFSGYENVFFTVYNRWGKEVFKMTDFDSIVWDGKSIDGAILSDGVYYFYVTGVRKTGSKKQMEYKGWVVISR